MSQFKPLNFATIKVFQWNQTLNFEVLPPFDILYFVTFWVFELLRNLSFWVESHFEFCHFWYFELCHILIFFEFCNILSHHNFTFLVFLKFKFLSFVTIWVFEFCQNKQNKSLVLTFNFFCFFLSLVGNSSFSLVKHF